jgi:hypothetical protein
MEQEYKVGLFGKIFYGIVAGGMAGFFGFMIISHPQDNKAVYLIGLLPIIICLLILVNLFKSKVIITSTSITRERVFYNKTLNFEDVKGARVGQKVIVIEPEEASLGKLRISNYSDFANSEELANRIGTMFLDLDKADLDKEKEVLLSDNSLGYTVEERESKINKMGQIAIAYTVWGFIMFFLLLFIRNNYLSFWVGVLYPLLGIVIMKFSNGLIKFVSDSKRSSYLGISIGFSMSVIILFVLAIAEFEVISFTNALPVAAVIAIALFILLYSVGINKTKASVKGQSVFMVIISLFYGFGNTVVANCLFDKSKPAKFQTQVVDEYISSGKGAHYHLKLNPWLPGQNIREVDVSEKSYYKTPVGSTVFIYEKKGLLNIPWFDFELDPTPPVPAGSNNGNSPAPR